MEALSSLALGPPSGSGFGSIPQVVHSPFDVFSSFGGRGGALHTFFVIVMESYCFSVAWLSIKGIAKHIKFSLQMVF
jgi:hypothetical protein